jgi:hypothetical protein
MTGAVVFSASSVNAYLDCHLRWYFGYVLNEQGEQSEAQAVGIAVHDVVERILNRTGSNLDFIDDPVIGSLIRLFNRDILPTYRTPLLVEASFQIEVNGIGFSGIIDALDQHDVPPAMAFPDFDMYWAAETAGMLPVANILRDTKTTGKRPAAGKYRFNMIGYYLGVTEGLDHEVHAMQLDYMVRTMKPYYWPEVQQIPDEDEVGAWAAQLETVANGVARADYEPTGLGTYVCSYCSYAGICGPYQRYKEVTNG